jgi:structure-specific recognition protein 1
MILRVTLLIRSDDLKNFNDLQKKYDGPTYRVISLVLKAMTDKKITPPSQNYRK